MKSWATNGNKQRREEVKEQGAKRLRRSQESEEDRALQEDVFWPEERENKRRRIQDDEKGMMSFGIVKIGVVGMWTS
eukprot:10965791-Karenia_brevis.AAC.1